MKPVFIVASRGKAGFAISLWRSCSPGEKTTRPDRFENNNCNNKYLAKSCKICLKKNLQLLPSAFSQYRRSLGGRGNMMHSPMHGGAPGGMVHPGPMGNNMDQLQQHMMAPVPGAGGQGGHSIA